MFYCIGPGSQRFRGIIRTYERGVFEKYLSAIIRFVDKVHANCRTCQIPALKCVDYCLVRVMAVHPFSAEYRQRRRMDIDDRDIADAFSRNTFELTGQTNKIGPKMIDACLVTGGSIRF